MLSGPCVVSNTTFAVVCGSVEYTLLILSLMSVSCLFVLLLCPVFRLGISLDVLLHGTRDGDHGHFPCKGEDVVVS